MQKLIFVNLPVRDLQRSTEFYKAVGAEQNMMFSDATASCMVFSDTIHVMLLTHEKFSHFSPRPIADANEVSQALFCLSAATRDEVDLIVEKAGAAGGAVDPSPVDEYDFMYGRSFADLDGHLWGINWMDLEAAKAAMANCPQSVEA